MVKYEQEVITVNPSTSTSRAIANASASVEMEGFQVTAQQKEITKAEYIRRVTAAVKGQ